MPLTGIGELPADVEYRVLERLDQHLARSRPDAELRSMLRGYGPGLPFDQHPQLAALNGFLASIQGPYSPDTPLGPLQARGALEAFWLSRNDLPSAPSSHLVSRVPFTRDGASYDPRPGT